MKKIITLSSVIILILVSGLSYMYFSKKEKAEKSFGGDNSIEGAMEWELMRHRDPKTGQIPRGIHQLEMKFAQTLPGSYQNIKTKYDKLLSTQWVQRGPNNIGGRTRALAVDIRNSNIMIAGGVSGGMWRSVDGGKNWMKTTRPDQLLSVSNLVQDKRTGHNDTWYYCTGEFWGNSAAIQGDGIFKSNDNGMTWNQLTATATGSQASFSSPFDYCWNIVVNNNNLIQDEALAAVIGGIERSTDGGNTWKMVLGGFNSNNSYFTDIAVADNGVFYATLSQGSHYYPTWNSPNKGIYRSVDGINWTNITPVNWPEKYSRVVIGIAPSDGNQVYFLAQSDESGKRTFNSQGDTCWHSLWKYTYLSGDGKGANGLWEDRSQGIPKPDMIRGHFNSQFSYDLVVTVKPDNPDIVFIGGTNIYRSTDGFRTDNNWTWIAGYGYIPDANGEYTNYPNSHSDIHVLYFDPANPNTLITGSDGGVRKTTDCMAGTVAWDRLEFGYFTTQFYNIACDHYNENDFLLGGLQDNETYLTSTSDVKKDWIQVTKGDGFCCTFGKNGIIYSSKNSKNNWQPKINIFKVKIDNIGNIQTRTRIDPAGGSDFIWDTPFILDPNNENIMYLAGGKIVWRNNSLDLIPLVDSYDSTSIGWDSLSNTREPTANITAVAASKSPANILYYGTSEGNVYRIDNADKGNPTPKKITGNAFPAGGNVSCIAIDPKDANKVIVAFSNYNVMSLFYSIDGGSNWTPISGNLEENPLTGGGNGPAIHWVEILPVGNKNLYFVGASTGLYSTAFIDGQFTTWQQEGAETIGNVVVNQIDVRESDGLVVVGTHGSGTFSAKITSMPQPPSAPALFSPKDNTKGVLLKPKLVWNHANDAIFYKVEVAKDIDFKDIFFSSDGIKSDSTDIPVLEQGLKTYYWRVFARSAGGMSGPSQVWSLRTAIGPPTLVNPPQSSDSISVTPVLQWQNVTGATAYHVVVATNLGMANKVVDTTGISDNKLQVNLQGGKKYFWKVSSIDQDGEGIQSAMFNFKTVTVQDVGDGTALKGYSLKSNYPNPCKNSTTIQFVLPISEKAIIKLFDFSGREIMTIADKIFYEGDNLVNLDVSKLPSGNYFYTISAGKFKDIKPMLVIK